MKKMSRCFMAAATAAASLAITGCSQVASTADDESSYFKTVQSWAQGEERIIIL